MDKRHGNQHEHKEEQSKPGACDAEKSVTLQESEYLQLKADAAKAQEHWDKFVRQQADIENIRKRLDKEKQDFLKFANEGIIVDLLNILDDLERTVALAQERHQDVAVFLKGVEMILAHVYDLLKKYGVRAIDAHGKAFDPGCQEALMQVENKDLPEHTVVEVLQKGYLMHDRVIRTAKVSVSKR